MRFEPDRGERPGYGLPETADMSDRVRLDVWLWRARFFRTRALAAAAIVGGQVRVDRAGQVRRVSKSGFGLKPGDVLVIGKGDGVTIVRLLAPGTRRGPAEEARGLYLVIKDQTVQDPAP